MQLIQDGIYSVEGLRLGRVYVIKSANGLTLVDTSIPGSLPQVKQELQSIGYQLSDIKQILLTHAHWDHYGGLMELVEVTGAKVYVHHRYESSVIRGERQPIFPTYGQLSLFDKTVLAIWIKPQLRKPLSIRVDVELKDGDHLDEVLPGLEVIDTPGHSPGHCGFWHPRRGILFGGDVMMRAPSGRFILPLAAATPQMDEAKRSIRKVADLNVSTICLGHGKPLIENAAPKIRAFANKFQV